METQRHSVDEAPAAVPAWGMSVEAPFRPGQGESAIELNGRFLSSYNGRRAAPVGDGALERFRHERIRAHRAGLGLQSADESDAGADRHELILGENNLLPFDFLRNGDRLGRAVVKVRRADGACGTGFLVAPDILLTNHHVLPDVETAAAAHAMANYEAAPPLDPAGRAVVVPLDPGALFVTNADLDFTFCGVGDLGHLGTVPMDRDSLSIMPSEFVNIIQHPRGRPKEVALRDNRVVKADNVVVHYSCDTEPGSSGSPVFNNQWRLVALHHASVETDSPSGRRPAGGEPGARFLNEGIRLSAIAIWLEAMEIDSPSQREQVVRLRRIFNGLDPQIGFFGALGRRAVGKTADQTVVECYRRGADDLDLAFWNLEGLASALPGRLPEIGWVLAGMGIDLWCLSHVGAEGLRLLCDHLDSHFRLDFRFLIDRDAAEMPLAIVFRRSRSLSVERLGREGDALRVLVRATTGRGREHPLLLEPLPRGVPAAGRSASRRKSSRRGAFRARRDDPDIDRLLLGDGITAEGLGDLSSQGPEARAAAGRDGGFALLPGPSTRIGPLHASPNLELTLGPPGAVVVAEDRGWPRVVTDLGSRPPVALRLTFASGADSPPAPPDRPRAASAPAPARRPAVPAAESERINPHDEDRLEQALRDMLAPILARLVAEARQGDSRAEAS